MTRTDASPADVGIDETKLAVLRNSIEKDIENGLSDGSVVLVARRGRIVMHEAIGYSDKRNGRKAQTKRCAARHVAYQATYGCDAVPLC
jgi:hypothetical protein